MIEPGTDLLHYRVVDKIGEGGMGVVWRALDTTLNREVAIKVLPEAFASNAERVARFEREAQLLAALNHPGIAGIYGLHQADGQHFIAMELVPGEDLAEHLHRGPLELDNALDVARQVAEALESAHEQGVIHRDLKPANIKRAPDGKIKVLDLGLAKAMATESAIESGSLSVSPTMTSAKTAAGTLLGTAAYMSPEQVKGREADRRSDIWAFGCVLREMLTGSKTFEGETFSEIMASVLRDDPADGDLPAGTPPSVRRLLARCLDRDPKTRLRDIGEARIALSPENLAKAEAESAGVSGDDGVDRRGAGSRLPWVVAAVAVLALAVAGGALLLRSDPPRPFEIRAAIAPPEGQRFEVNSRHSGALTISPDGRMMTFSSMTDSGRPSLFLRRLDSDVAQVIAGSEDGGYPFWSPDSRQIAFFADGHLKKIDVDGGAPMTLAPAPNGRGGTWNRDGNILFAPDTQSPIQLVSTGGVSGDAVTTLDPARSGESTHRFPVFLPDGRHFLYHRGSHAAGPSDPVNSIWIGDIESDETRELMASETNALYGQGHLFWVREQFLMARRFSPERREFEGEAFAVGEGVVVQPNFWRGAFAVSEAGPLAFQTGLAVDVTLTWMDRQGNQLGTISEVGRYEEIRLSPDDRRLAVGLSDGTNGNSDVWVIDLERDVASRLTFDDANDSKPVWSPDGERIAFESNRGGTAPSDIYVRRTDGRGEAELLFGSESQDVPQDWSRDGKYLVVDRGIGKYNLWLVPLDGGDPIALIESEFDVGYGRFSPDSRWIAYASNESGRYEMYITRVPSGEGKWQVTQMGADWIVGWNDAGTEVYYLDLEANLCVVDIELGDRVVAGTPRILYTTPSNDAWDSGRDGKRFVFGIPDDDDENFPITLIVNWEHGVP